MPQPTKKFMMEQTVTFQFLKRRIGTIGIGTIRGMASTTINKMASTPPTMNKTISMVSSHAYLE